MKTILVTAYAINPYKGSEDVYNRKGEFGRKTILFGKKSLKLLITK